MHFFAFFFIAVTVVLFFFFFFNDPATTEIYTLSLHDALPIFAHGGAEATREAGGVLGQAEAAGPAVQVLAAGPAASRSEEHTSELQSQSNLVCRLLLEKKKTKKKTKQNKTQKQEIYTTI